MWGRMGSDRQQSITRFSVNTLACWLSALDRVDALRVVGTGRRLDIVLDPLLALVAVNGLRHGLLVKEIEDCYLRSNSAALA